MSEFPAFLLDGYKSFMAHRYEPEEARYKVLADKGQSPTTMIIACCDSRSAPETIFDAGPGEMFVVRNVANLVPPFQPDAMQHGTSAAIEFAVVALNISNIVIMGHGRCGGIRAALDPHATPLAQGDFIGKWMTLLSPASEAVSKYTLLTSKERQTMLEHFSVRNSITNLRTFPYVKALEDEGKLAIHGAWFDISTGELWVMDADGDFYRPDV
jgi:carbonic anhydrase